MPDHAESCHKVGQSLDGLIPAIDNHIKELAMNSHNPIAAMVHKQHQFPFSIPKQKHLSSSTNLEVNVLEAGAESQTP
jgi:hypothetical protein